VVTGVIIRIEKVSGKFAQDKDIAREIRQTRLIPALKKKQDVALDFSGVEDATQSFIHALITEPIRDFGIEVLDKVVFKECNETVRKIVEIVVDYMQHEDEKEDT
jgi:hypothetical protein